LVILFAIKAKMRWEESEDQESTEYIVPQEPVSTTPETQTSDQNKQ
jgi:hypothetical protein